MEKKEKFFRSLQFFFSKRDDRDVALPTQMRFSGAHCLQSKVHFPSCNSIRLVDTAVEMRHRKLLEHLGVRPMMPSEWGLLLSSVKKLEDFVCS